MPVQDRHLMNHAESWNAQGAADTPAGHSAFSHRWLSDFAYGLLNPLRLDREEWEDLPVTRLAPPELKVQAEFMPLLLSFNDLTAPQRAILLGRIEAREQQGDSYLCGLLNSDAEKSVLSAHLSRLLVMTRQDNGQRYLLRYYDPRVMRHLQWLLTDKQHVEFCGPISVWSWPASSGWITGRRLAQYSPGQRLVLRPHQWATLERLALMNRALTELEILAPDLSQNDALFQWLDAALLQASTDLALTDSEDWLFCAIQSVRFHPQIHHHPQLLERLGQAATKRGSYAAACADLDDSAWLSMVEELNSRMPTA
ncbi:conserved hypothetical protein [Cupriavidus taiwanensis]|nr:conserved hypothetical protein [Cupriavidus taiwanensis]SPA56460.1 conserved hypothetical protein [Cupriavidus taiwanensis]